MTARYLVGDVFDHLATLETGSVDLVVTSPPFLALRSYLPADHPDKDREIGSEATPAEFIDVMLRVTQELRRVLAPHGSICIELGDTYAGSGESGWERDKGPYRSENRSTASANGLLQQKRDLSSGWPLPKSKALIAELYRIGLAYGVNPLTGAESPAGRWRVRNVVTWVRPNPPVGALGDKWRPATSDLVVACTSGKRYWDDLATRGTKPEAPHGGWPISDKYIDAGLDSGSRQTRTHSAGAPLLDWWEIPPGGYKGSHYAVFPEELVIPCVQAMCPPKVCRTCGEPSRRIVNVLSQGEGGVHPGNNGGGATGYGKGHRSRHESETLGWTECGHGVGCRITTWKMVEVPVEQGRVRGSKWVDLDKWELPIEPTETRIRIKRRRVVDDIGECSDPSHWRPGLILDPFAGSGTTLSVATGYGHDAIGIDLDQRNAELALERVGPFLLDVEA